jgi:hypothetical protein
MVIPFLREANLIILDWMDRAFRDIAFAYEVRRGLLVGLIHGIKAQTQFFPDRERAVNEFIDLGDVHGTRRPHEESRAVGQADIRIFNACRTGHHAGP